MSRSGAELVISRLERTTPQVLALAELLAPAVRSEGTLVRRLRTELLPHVGAEAEAELWFSPLVQSHSADGIALSVPAAVALRQRLTQQWETRRLLLERARAIYTEVHAYLPPPLRLEEEIAWCLIAGDEDGVNARVDRAVAAVVADPDGFRFWVTQAAARLPNGVRRTDSGTLLARAGVDREFTGQVWETAYRTLGTRPLAVRHTGAEIELGFPAGPGSRRVDVPDAALVPLRLRWSGTSAAATQEATVILRGDVVQARVPVSGHVEVRTAAGVTYVVRDDPFDRPVRVDPDADPDEKIRAILGSVHEPGLRSAERDEAAEIGVELRGGQVTLVDAAGGPFPGVPRVGPAPADLSPDESALDPAPDDSAARVVKLAAHVSRWLTVAELRSTAPDLIGAVEVTVGAVTTGQVQAVDATPGDSVTATVANLGPEPLYVAVLAMSSDWSAEVLAAGSVLDTGARWSGSLRLDVVGAGQDEGFVRVVGVAARHPFDPGPLALVPIGQVVQGAPSAPSPATSLPADASLDREFAAMTGVSGARLLPPYREWITGEATVWVRSSPASAGQVAPICWVAWCGRWRFRRPGGRWSPAAMTGWCGCGTWRIRTWCSVAC